MINIFDKNKNRGFTILETMVAVFILVLSITGPMAFASSSLRSAFLARDQITAFFLAQDIIEVVKNSRDENGLLEYPWLYNIDICGDPGQPCTVYIDTTAANPTATECLNGICPVLRLDENGRFNYDLSVNSSESRFTRTTHIRETVANQEAQVVVEVEWDSGVRVGNARIIVQENITNWIPISTTTIPST